MKLEFDELILNRFSKYRELKKLSADVLERVKSLQEENAALQKQAESDKALIDSLNRYIETLEVRDKERVNHITEREERCREYRKTINELREHLSGILPRTEEMSP